MTACVCTIIAIAICLVSVPTPGRADTRRLFCALVPHFKDDYWLSVGFGLEQEAARQNVELLFFEAGGYRASATQIAQLDTCVAQNVDAILIGAVTSDHPALTDAVARVAQRVPVFGLVNALQSDTLSGHVGVDWRDMGAVVGRHLRKLHPEGSAPKTALFLTGPAEAGWTGPLEAGLRNGLEESSVKILEVFQADTGLRAQLDLVETALLRHPNADYLIGDAPAIEAAFGLFATETYPIRPVLVSTYISHAILRGLQNGHVLAASFDDPVQQGIMAIRLASVAKSTPNRQSVLGPNVKLLTRDDHNFEHIHLSPADYFPALQ